MREFLQVFLRVNLLSTNNHENINFETGPCDGIFTPKEENVEISYKEEE